MEVFFIIITALGVFAITVFVFTRPSSSTNHPQPYVEHSSPPQGSIADAFMAYVFKRAEAASCKRLYYKYKSELEEDYIALVHGKFPRLSRNNNDEALDALALYYLEDIPSLIEKPKEDCFVEIAQMLSELGFGTNFVFSLDAWKIVQQICQSHFETYGVPNKQTVDKRNHKLEEILQLAKKWGKESHYYYAPAHFLAVHFLDVIYHNAFQTGQIRDFFDPDVEDSLAENFTWSITVLYLSGKFNMVYEPDQKFLDSIFFISSFTDIAIHNGFSQEEITNHLLNEADVFSIMYDDDDDDYEEDDDDDYEEDDDDDYEEDDDDYYEEDDDDDNDGDDDDI